MAEPAAYLVIALSGRALAVAARRAGRVAFVADLFGDTDTRSHAAGSLVVAGSLEKGFEESALLAAAEYLAPAWSRPQYGLVYASGLEDRPHLLAALCEGRQLLGNRPETVHLTKDPRAFFKLLDDLRIPHPTVTFTSPADPTGWLQKRIGASGGGHVVPAAAGGDIEGRYFQRRISGRPIGVSFLADGKRALVLGFSEQWSSPEGVSSSFRFGGALQPAAIDAKITTRIPELLNALVREIGLVGLNSLDMIVDAERFAVIEVNPRPGANLDIFDTGASVGLFELHVRACQGGLPEDWQAPAQATAMAVIYADRPSFVPIDLRWPDWVADRPAPGVHIELGAPVCTVLAAAPTAIAVRSLIEQRGQTVRSEFLTEMPVPQSAGSVT